MDFKQEIGERLADGSPKCANCKHYGSIGRNKSSRPPTMFEMVIGKDLKEFKTITAKGACLEPSAFNSTTPIVVTDLSLCSLWEIKEKT